MLGLVQINTEFSAVCNVKYKYEEEEGEAGRGAGQGEGQPLAATDDRNDMFAGYTLQIISQV